MLTNESILTLSEAAAKLPPSGGRRVNVSTLWRWAFKGVSGVKLEVLRLGGRTVTSLEALERFGRALAEVPPRSRRTYSKNHSGRTPGQRERALADAAKTLERAGI